MSLCARVLGCFPSLLACDAPRGMTLAPSSLPFRSLYAALASLCLCSVALQCRRLAALQEERDGLVEALGGGGEGGGVAGTRQGCHRNMTAVCAGGGGGGGLPAKSSKGAERRVQWKLGNVDYT